VKLIFSFSFRDLTGNEPNRYSKLRRPKAYVSHGFGQENRCECIQGDGRVTELR
jgi:hypothetical protein